MRRDVTLLALPVVTGAGSHSPEGVGVHMRRDVTLLALPVVTGAGSHSPAGAGVLA